MKLPALILFCILIIPACAGRRIDTTSYTEMDFGRDVGLQYVKKSPDGTFTSVTMDQDESKSVGKVIGGAIAKAFSGNVDTAISAGSGVLENRDSLSGANEGARIAGQNTVSKINAETAASVATSEN